jgi:integrase/recombinase XerD
MLRPLWLHQTQASCGKSSEKAQRRGQISLLAGRHADPFSKVGKPLPTSFDASVDLRDVQIAARHADPRTTMRYDRGRQNLDRHPNYIVAAYMACGT